MDRHRHEVEGRSALSFDHQTAQRKARPRKATTADAIMGRAWHEVTEHHSRPRHRLLDENRVRAAALRASGANAPIAPYHRL